MPITKFSTIIWMLMAAVIVTIFQTTSSEANQFKRIRDVNVSCNNALRCDLYIVNPAVSLYNIGLRRSAATDAPVSLFLTLREALAAGSSVSIDIDGDAVISVPVDELRYRAASGEYQLSANPAVEQFFTAAASGIEMRVTYRTRRGQSTATYSLSGFVAGVIFMDEVQGRIGNDDALQLALDGERSGAGAAEATNVAWRQLNRVPAGLITYYNFEDRLCGQMDTTLAGRVGGFELQLSDSTGFVAFPCTRGGAYNQPYSVFQRFGSAYVPHMLPVVIDGNPSATYYVYNLEWDPEEGELVSFFKGRGVGDCGEIRRWSVQGDAFEANIQLTSSRVKDTCDGIGDLDAPAWVPVWPQAATVR
ncbi:MAG: DUF1176 domain-containing protein [Pseudomonadota bacterium]